MLVGQSALLIGSHFTRASTVIPVNFQVVGDGSQTILNYLPFHSTSPPCTKLGSHAMSGSQGDLSQNLTPSRTLPLLTSPSPIAKQHFHTPQFPMPSAAATISKSVEATPELFSQCYTSPESSPSYCTPLVLHRPSSHHSHTCSTPEIL